ncbi:hypothetical protein [Bradyrhizobium sp. S3.2.12]|uniref:hypothetical protein n=1 Tax=Bradyrhizobium sp. S3.2.12 TaxID=3156387 RepID=UPI0033942778
MTLYAQLLLIIFAACFWIALLAAVVTTVARLGTEAKERRSQNEAAHLSKAGVEVTGLVWRGIPFRFL